MIVFQDYLLSFDFEDININLSYNQIGVIDLSDFKNAVFNSAQSMESTKLQNITLQLGNNPMQCDCRLMNFLPLIKRKITTKVQTYINFLIDDLYCNGPYYMINKSLKSLDLEDIKCDWLRTNNTDACNDICSCWKFPESQKIHADCSQKNLKHLPNLVGKFNNWTTELNLSRNRIKYLPFLKNDTFKHISVLDLSNNSISSTSVDIFSDSLQVLKLHGNKITKLDDAVIQHLKNPNISLTNLMLHKNP